jgi:hypothetical protein
MCVCGKEEREGGKKKGRGGGGEGKEDWVVREKSVRFNTEVYERTAPTFPLFLPATRAPLSPLQVHFP